MRFSIILSVLVASISGSRANAEAPLGTFKLDHVYVQPALRVQEGRRGGFLLPSTYLGGSWVYSDEIAARLKFGTRDLRPVPSRFRDSSQNDLALVEAFAEYNHWIGQFKAGVIPIEFGNDGGDSEERQLLPRPLFYTLKLLPLRDYGAAFKSNYSGLTTELGVFNGEGDADQDNESWYFAFARMHMQTLELGLSLATGRSLQVPAGTTNLTTDGFDRARSARWRFNNIFFNYFEGGWQILGDAHYFEVVQDTGNGSGYSCHLDLIAPLAKKFYFASRWDQIELRTDVSGDARQEASLGFLQQSQYQNSVLGIWFTRKWMELEKLPSHEIFVYWKIKSSEFGIN